ncbi:hypothetical protein BDR06DRAFT_947092 [Suillus hirtellus]|nr:hypothetical protein BDR06DRAFT_947092 [Suillus hirtellus]
MEILPSVLPDLLRYNLQCEKRICIIGAGAGGLAALKVVSESACFKSGKWLVIAYETREKVGGVWLPSPPVIDDYNASVTPLYVSHIGLAIQYLWLARDLRPNTSPCAIVWLDPSYNPSL